MKGQKIIKTKMKKIRNQITDIENSNHYTLNIEILNNEKSKSEKRKMNIEKCLFFENLEDLKKYSSLNKIEISNTLTDKRNGENIVFGHKIVNNDKELEDYFQSLKNQIQILKNKSK